MEESEKIWAIVISAIAGAGALASAFINLTIAGPIIGVIAGSVITYFAQSKSQKRLWKRDFIIKNIETIYGPLYNASLRIEQNLSNINVVRSYREISKDEWSTIQHSFVYHMIDDDILRRKIEDFYGFIDLFNYLCYQARIRSHQIIEKRASEFYLLNVQNIHYRYVQDDGGSGSSDIFDCIVFKIHPKDAYPNKTNKIAIVIEHKVHNTIPQLIIDSPEKIQEFDKLWLQMIDDVNQDQQLKELESLKLRIPTKNSEIRQELVKKISERHNL